MLFLGISAFVGLLCTFLYAFIFPKLSVLKYYRMKAASEGSQTVSADLAVVGIQTEQSQVWRFLFLFIIIYLFIYFYFKEVKQKRWFQISISALQF